MTEVPEITWRELTGNKFSRALDAAMASEAGYIAFQRIRRVGDAVAQPFYVQYDHDFLVQVILRKIIKPLFVLGKEKVNQLVEDAWVLYEAETPQALSSFENNN